MFASCDVLANAHEVTGLFEVGGDRGDRDSVSVLPAIERSDLQVSGAIARVRDETPGSR